MRPKALTIFTLCFLAFALYLQFQFKLEPTEIASRVELPAKLQNGISTFAFSPRGDALASADEKGIVTLWDVRSGKPRLTLASQSSLGITGLGFSPDGAILATFVKDAISLWDPIHGQQRQILRNDAGVAIAGLSFSPDNRVLVSVDEDARLTLWNLDSGTVRQRIENSHDSVAVLGFSADGTLLATGGKDASVKLWNVASGQQQLALSNPSGAAITGLAFNPHGPTLATIGEDARITLWDGQSGSVQRTLLGHGDIVQSIAFSPDGALLASAGRDGHVKLWDVASGQERSTLLDPFGAPVAGVAFNAEGNTLASVGADARILLWNTATGQLREILSGHTSPVTDITFLSQQLFASASVDGRFIVWDLQNGTPTYAVQTPARASDSFSSAPVQPSVNEAEQKPDPGQIGPANSKTTAPLASEADRKSEPAATVVNRDPQASSLRAPVKKKGIVALAISADGSRVGSAGDDGVVRLWDADANELMALAGHSGRVIAGLAFSAGGQRLASAGRDSEIRVWDATTGKQTQMLLAHEHPIRAIAASPDGRWLASAGEETRVMLWDAETGKLRAILNGHNDFVNSVAFSADGRRLATAGADSRILIWDVATGKNSQVLLGHSDQINALTFSPDGKNLASAGQDLQVILWDAATGRRLQTLTGHQAPIRALAFSRDSKTLVSAGQDAQLLAWNTANGKARKIPTGASSFINGLVFTPNGRLLVGGENNQLSQWDIASGTKLKTVGPVKQPLSSALPVPSSNWLDHSIAAPRYGASLTVKPADQTADLPGASRSTVLDNILDWIFPAAQAQTLPNPNQGPGGPILVIDSASSIFGKYYAEILRTEGFNAFTVADVSTVTPATLANYDVAILAPTTLSATQVTTLTDWVTAGGNLIAMRPDPQLAGLLGLNPVGSTLTNGYLLVNTAQAPGNGIVNQTIQFHGVADRYSLNGATSVALLYSNANTSTANPAVSLRAVGSNGGQAAAFTYDLATSIVYTRQGNPAWAAQERDGLSPIRSNDKFYGASASDPQPDWVDLSKVAIPQADEQQRLLANLILTMNLDRKPLPRFWYFPRGKKAVVIMTGDDHGNNGTQGRFDQFKALSPAGCSVANWECVRGTSYIFPNTPLTDAQAAAYHADGFEVGLHVNTNCADYTPTSLENFYTQQISGWTGKYASVPAPITQRHHCIAWSDWVTGAKVQFGKGIRLDTSYYFWPPQWVANVPGLFTGSAMPMRFADLDGALVDVYHAATQMTDESGQQYPYTIDTLLDRALGVEGYYGAYTINAHTDVAQIPESDAVVASALARGVPIVSSRQMLDWLDGRNSSSFGTIAWIGNALSFSITTSAGANGLQALVPMISKVGTLTSITFNASPISFTEDTVKGVQYARISAASGNYVATYAADTTPPNVTAKAPADGATAISQGTAVTVTFSEAIDAATLNNTTFALRNPSNAPVSGTVSYNASTRTATLTPTSPLTALTTYTATVVGGSTDPRVKDLAGNALGANMVWSFTTEAQPCASSPCSAWTNSTIPATPAVNDPNAVELGVKFTVDLDGFITGIRFYKGSTNTGTHVGNLWTLAGTNLATAIFSNETASGWQQVTFSSPVAVTANTVYVASYHAPNGNYAATNSPEFATLGVDNGPVHLLKDGISGGNGVYAYGANSTFPANTYLSSNYWVDVVFSTTVGPDTTPPTVTTRSPAPGASGVSTATTVTATFNESIDPATINGTTVELRNASNALVTATVSYNAATKTATLLPSAALANNATYTATLKGGATDPRIKDIAGNALAANAVWSFSTAATADTTPPTVTGRTPAANATGISPATSVTATFSEALNAATVTATTFELRNAGNTLVPASVSYNAATLTATLTPTSALNAASTYTATVKGGTGGVKDAAGNALAPDVTWSFTTASSEPSACPGGASIWPTDPTPAVVTDPDASAIELGVKFRSTVNGFICGIRFYRSSANTGTHVGTLWNNAGQPLAQVTFTNETASGWQQASFATPVAITANTVYTASYHAPVGRYSVNENYFNAGFTSGNLYALSSAESGGNGVYRYGASGFPTSTYQASNYWVDVVFTTSTGPDTTPPTVTTTSPTANATGVNPANSVTATFSEAVDPASITASTFELRDNGGSLVTAAISYATNVATLTPSTALTAATTYTVTVKGGASGAKDLAGNPLATDMVWSFTTGVDPCASGGNPIVCENGLTGNPSSEWDVSGAGDASIQGYATEISVNHGETVRFKINTPATDYRLDIYRLGYYAGNGARKIATVQPSATLPQNQPTCLSDSATGLIDCGNWTESASWAVPANAVSGIYFAKAVREDGANAGKSSHIVFVVRDDASTSDLLFQTSDTTWQAYNTFGGNSLYVGSPAGRAYKVSYNRPFNTRSVDNGQDWLFNAEYPMVRWLEANGYHVSYFTGVDSDRRGNLIANHKVFLSVGHDEYWSGTQRANVEAARNAGVHLAFFSGNEVFWKTRWENGIDASGAPYRTLVCYKETHAGAKIDPLPNVWTGTWRDPRFSPPADGGRPENALIGTIFTVNDGATTSITVPEADGKMRFWRNTSVAALAPNATATLPFGTLGYEWDEDLDNGFRPAGLIRLSTTTVNGAPILTDYGSTFGSGTATHALTLYRHSSGALVFGSGTVQWPWGLDSNHDRGGTATDSSMQQATVNLFADMGAQPATLQSSLVAATPSTDALTPSSVITSPTSSSTIQPGSAVTITGTASDSGGGLVGGIEVSVDGGASWRRATGRANWTYGWTAPSTPGSVTIRSRAADDSGNLEVPGAGVTVTVGSATDTTPPSAPNGLVATPSGTTQINLTWTAATDNVGVTGYRVERCQGSGCANFTQIATPTATSFANTGLTAGTTYQYRVRATDAAGNLGAYSAVATAATPAADTTPPTAPTGLTATTVSATQINLAWTAATDNVGVMGYRVERCQGGGCSNFAQIATLATTTFSNTGLTAGTTYQYQVRAVDAAGNLGPYSAIATATTALLPVAVNDTFLFRASIARTIDYAGPFGRGVLANDTSPVVPPSLTAVVVGALPTGVTLAANGVVNVNRSANTSFGYRAQDGALLSLPTTGATVTLRVDSAPTTVMDNCTYSRAGAGSITVGTACVMAGAQTFTMNLTANDTDPNTTTNVPSDGIGDAVTGAVIVAAGTGVVVSPSSCQTGLGTIASRATMTNNCDGTATVVVATGASASPISFTYRAIDDLGAQSANRANTVTVQ